ncbi:MAG TPA: peptidoglycan DD-metalloendopeptidase family protein [Armatimonadetes bacterium]|nr:peptidoglycan DD-metalloendopeptidase family protein [Armatimonadota bacterium]
MFRRTRRGLAILCAMVWAIVSLASVTHAAKRKSAPATKKATQRKLASLRQEIRSTRRQLRHTKHRQRKVSEELRESQENLRCARERLRQVRARLACAERDLADAQQRLDIAQRQLATHVIQLRGRLVDIYKYGTVSYATVLLQSNDMWDLTSRGYVLQRIVHHDVRLLNRIKAEKAAIALQTRRLAARRDDVARLRVSHERQIVAVTDCLQTQRQIQETLKRDRARLEAALAELEENSREVERMLKAFEARSDIDRRIPNPWRGRFARPVAGQITSHFGTRFHPILKVTKLHTGVDIAAPSGTPIAAVGDGVVVHAGWWGGYGNCVVVAHGNGRSTLYAHCSSLAVSEGARVRKGQILGRVGSTGFSTGPHLHFEVRINGRPVNPLSH